MNKLPFDIPLERLRDEGIYPRDRGYGREAYQYFALPQEYSRERVIRAIETYLMDAFDARSINVWQGRARNEVKATWRE